MGRLVQLILRTLDGTPQSRPKKRQLGQSLVEMALVTPILAILIAGIVEIGWYANHILILQEVARVGARSGTVLSGDFAPDNWFSEASIAEPVLRNDNAYDADYGYFPASSYTPPDASLNYRDCDVAVDYPGFYNFIACLMLDSMDPLVLREGQKPSGEDYIDDIVISTFSLMAINNGNYSLIDPDTDAALRRRTHDFAGDPYPNGSSIIVVGRYPTNANECTHDTGGWRSDTTVDPFNYLTGASINGDLLTEALVPREYFTSDSNKIYVELEGYDEEPEYQRGFVWFGQHIVESEDTICWGSEWSDDEVVELMNLPHFLDVDCAAEADPSKCNSDKAARRELLPSQGMTLVEIFWEHDMLLDFPFFTVWSGFGDLDVIVISTWSAFPLPSVEPNIIYRLEN